MSRIEVYEQALETLLELEDLKKDNKEMNIETCILAVLLFVIMVVLAIG